MRREILSEFSPASWIRNRTSCPDIFAIESPFEQIQMRAEMRSRNRAVD